MHLIIKAHLLFNSMQLLLVYVARSEMVEALDRLGVTTREF